MRTLKTSEAASLLNVSPNTLRSWERLVPQVEPDSDDSRMLQKAIDAAYAASGKASPKGAAAAQANAKPKSNGDGASAKAGEATAAASVSGQVVLDAALKAKAYAATADEVVKRYSK